MCLENTLILSSIFSLACVLIKASAITELYSHPVCRPGDHVPGNRGSQEDEKPYCKGFDAHGSEAFLKHDAQENPEGPEGTNLGGCMQPVVNIRQAQETDHTEGKEEDPYEQAEDTQDI